MGFDEHMAPDITDLRERLELMAKVFDTVSSGSLYSRTIREASAALLSSAEAREEAERLAEARLRVIQLSEKECAHHLATIVHGVLIL